LQILFIGERRDIMSAILQLIVLAMIGEAVWETLKMTWQQGKFSIDKIGALIIGLLIAIGTGLDLFELVQIPIAIPYLGLILTGVLLSRGANFVHDLLKKIEPPKGLQGNP